MNLFRFLESLLLPFPAPSPINSIVPLWHRNQSWTRGPWWCDPWYWKAGRATWSTLLKLTLAQVAASCPEGCPLSVLLRWMKMLLCLVIHLVLCWKLLLLQQSQQRESRPVPWLLHPVVSLSLTWKRVGTRMPKWKPDCLQCGHGSSSSRDVSENSGQQCLKTLKLGVGQRPGICWVKPFFKPSVLS